MRSREPTIGSSEFKKVMVEDRRDVPRYQLTLPILIGQDAWGVTRNLSLDGVLFESKQPYEVDSNLELTVYVTVDSAPSVMRLQATGHVLRSEPLPDGRYATAARLENVRVLTDASLDDHAATLT